MRSKIADKILSETPQAVKDFVKNYANNMMTQQDKERIEKDAEAIIEREIGISPGRSLLIPMDYGECLRCIIAGATKENEHLREHLKQERNKAIDEVQAKGNDLAQVLRKADPVMFPTLVIRAEAIEDFCKTLTAHGRTLNS